MLEDIKGHILSQYTISIYQDILKKSGCANTFFTHCTYAAKHPHQFEYIDGTRFRAVVSRFILAEGEIEIL